MPKCSIRPGPPARRVVLVHGCCGMICPRSSYRPPACGCMTSAATTTVRMQHPFMPTHCMYRICAWPQRAEGRALATLLARSVRTQKRCRSMRRRSYTKKEFSLDSTLRACAADPTSRLGLEQAFILFTHNSVKNMFSFDFRFMDRCMSTSQSLRNFPQDGATKRLLTLSHAVQY